MLLPKNAILFGKASDLIARLRRILFVDLGVFSLVLAGCVGVDGMLRILGKKKQRVGALRFAEECHKGAVVAVIVCGVRAVDGHIFEHKAVDMRF